MSRWISDVGEERNEEKILKVGSGDVVDWIGR
jgi:hypothetical protein